MMNMVDELKDEKVELMFDRWKYDTKAKKVCKIFLEDFTNPKEVEYKDTKYYIFEGCFKEENYHNIIPFKKVDFWFTKRAFDNAIIRVVAFEKLDATKKYDLNLSITRLTRFVLMLSDVIIQD